jgi:hypothetical protein
MTAENISRRKFLVAGSEKITEQPTPFLAPV